VIDALVGDQTLSTVHPFGSGCSLRDHDRAPRTACIACRSAVCHRSAVSGCCAVACVSGVAHRAAAPGSAPARASASADRAARAGVPRGVAAARALTAGIRGASSARAARAITRRIRAGSVRPGRCHAAVSAAAVGSASVGFGPAAARSALFGGGKRARTAETHHQHGETERNAALYRVAPLGTHAPSVTRGVADSATDKRERAEQ